MYRSNSNHKLRACCRISYAIEEKMCTKWKMFGLMSKEIIKIFGTYFLNLRERTKVLTLYAMV